MITLFMAEDAMTADHVTGAYICILENVAAYFTI